MKSIVIHELEAFYLRHPELKGIPVSLNQIKERSVPGLLFERRFPAGCRHRPGQ